MDSAAHLETLSQYPKAPGPLQRSLMTVCLKDHLHSRVWLWKNCHVQRTRPSSCSCSCPWHLITEFLMKLPQCAAMRAVWCLLRVEPSGTSPTLITCEEFLSVDSQMLGVASAFDRSFPAFFTLVESFRGATKVGFLTLTTVTQFS